MTKVFNLEVREKPKELKELIRKQSRSSRRDSFAAPEGHRVRALYLYRTGEAKSRRHMAALLGCAESTIYRWFKTYQKEGLKGLLTVQTSPGRPRKIQGQALQDLQKQLKTRTGFGSYREIQAWLAQQHQLDLAYSTVHGTVRYGLQAKLKASRPRSSEADPKLQASFKKNSQPSPR